MVQILELTWLNYGEELYSILLFRILMIICVTTDLSTLKRGGLSPAYDLNPVPLSQGLHLNITDSDNRLDYQLAFDVADFSII